MMIGKRRAREMALQMLYQQDLGQRPVEEVLESFDPAALAWGPDEEDPEPPEAGAVRRPDPPSEPVPVLSEREAERALSYARRLVVGAVGHREDIDRRIREQAENWRLERMPVIDRNILRLALYEMIWEEGVPNVVILDEAIELAKLFGSDKSSRFVNGLLDGVLKRLTVASESPRDASAEKGTSP